MHIRAHVHVCMFICGCVPKCVHVDSFICVRADVHRRIRMFMWMPICVFIFVHGTLVYARVITRVHIRTRVRARERLRSYVRIRARVRIRVRVRVRERTSMCARVRVLARARKH